MILSGLIPLAVNSPPTLPDSIALHGQGWLLDCLDLLCSGGPARASHEVITNDFWSVSLPFLHSQAYPVARVVNLLMDSSTLLKPRFQANACGE